MLGPEHEQKLQQIVSRLDDEELDALLGLSAHIYEETSLRAERCYADAILEVKRDSSSPFEVGSSYGESVGTKKAGESVVNLLGKLMTSPIRVRQ